MKYQILITPSAKKDIKKLDQVVKVRIQKKLEYFAKNNDPLVFATALVGSKIGSYRWRIGVFRVIFDVDNDKIVILRIRHRRDVYKD